MHVRRPLLILLALLTATAGCFGAGDDAPPPAAPRDDAPSTAPPAPLQAFALDARGCHQLLFAVPVDSARVREMMPESYTIAGETAGKVAATVGITRCESLSVDGASAGPAILSEVGVLIAAPDGSAGQHGYLLWQTTDASALREPMAALSVRGALVAGASFEARDGPLGPQSAAASMPWTQMPFELSATAAGATMTGALPASTWWHEGEHGTIRLAYAFAAGSWQPANGAVSAAEDSMFAPTGAGGVQVPASGAMIQYDWRGQVGPSQEG